MKDETKLWIFIVCVILAISTALGLWLPDHHATQLANAICEEKYGMEFDDYIPSINVPFYTIKGIKCKKPMIVEDYDGLIVKIDKTS